MTSSSPSFSSLPATKSPFLFTSIQTRAIFFSSYLYHQCLDSISRVSDTMHGVSTLCTNCILSDLQSGFRKKKHSAVTATMKVLNDIISTIGFKSIYCAALFLDLSTAVKTADHFVLSQRLLA